MRPIFTILFLTVASVISAQRVAENAYWFYFSDKKNQPFSINNPYQFLSERSVNRRAWQSIPITEMDLPVSGKYVDSLKSMNLEIKHISKWLNGVLIVTENKPLIDTLHRISFIDTIPWSPDKSLLFYPDTPEGNRFPPPLNESVSFKYGSSTDQIKMIDLDYLHNNGYTGKGVLIAVLDGGFIDMPSLPAFIAPLSNGQVTATKNFVNKSNEVYRDHPHGTYVASIIIGNLQDTLIGTAPDANLILATTENVFSETRVEEFAWIEGAEWADSLGADIINTSLGYTTFDDSTTDYTYSNMDGKTAPISISGSMLSSMGIIGVTSAGNEGNDPWHYISAPADAENILAVGAVSSDRSIAGFSSRGPTSDRRIKPDLVAMGAGTTFQSTNGIATGNGTSFSAPLISGAVASLWQAYPDMHAEELMDWIIIASSQFNDPDINYGFGIPSFAMAFHKITSMPLIRNEEANKIIVYPNPVTDILHIKINEQHSGNYSLKIYDLQGRIVFTKPIILPGETTIPGYVQPGLYILELSDSRRTLKTMITKY